MNVATGNGVVFNSSKCIIKERSVSFFGLIYGIDGIKPDPERIRDIQDMPPPRDKKELLQFLGLMTILSPFIQNLAEKASILRNLLKEYIMFMSELHHQCCFDGLKHNNNNKVLPSVLQSGQNAHSSDRCQSPWTWRGVAARERIWCDATCGICIQEYIGHRKAICLHRARFSSNCIRHAEIPYVPIRTQIQSNH